MENLGGCMEAIGYWVRPYHQHQRQSAEPLRMLQQAPGSSCRTLSGELLDSQPRIRNDLGLKSAIQDKVLRSLPN